MKLFAVLFLLCGTLVHSHDTKPFEIFGSYGTAQQGWKMTNMGAGIGYRKSFKPFDEWYFRYGYTFDGYDQYRVGTKKRVLTFPHLGVEWTSDYGFSVLRDTGVVKPAISSGTYLVVPMDILCFSIGAVIEKTTSVDPFWSLQVNFSYSFGKSR
jgi:hypothetical protein